MNELRMRSRKKSKTFWKQMKTNSQQNLWDTAKAVLRGKFIAMQAYLKKKKKRNISNRQPNPTPTRT